MLCSICYDNDLLQRSHIYITVCREMEIERSRTQIYSIISLFLCLSSVLFLSLSVYALVYNGNNELVQTVKVEIWCNPKINICHANT